jgi:hypothetical protein
MNFGPSFGGPFGAKGNVSQGAGVTNVNAMGNDVATQLANLGVGIQGGPTNIQSTGTISNDTHIDQNAHADANETIHFAPQSGGGL